MTVTLPYDPEWKALEWAKKHCQSYISNQAGGTTAELCRLCIRRLKNEQRK